MPQALPILPQLPGLDGRTAEARPRPADPVRRSEHRELFDRLLDRFSRPDVANDARQDTPREPAAEIPTEAASEPAHDDVADADGEPVDKETNPAKDGAADTVASSPEIAVIVPATVTAVQVQAGPVAPAAIPVVEPQTTEPLASQSQATAGIGEGVAAAAEAGATMTMSAAAAAPTDAGTLQAAAVDGMPAADRPVRTAAATATPAQPAVVDKKPTLAKLAAGLAAQTVAEQPAEPKFDFDALRLKGEPAVEAAQQRPDVKVKGPSTNGTAQTIAPLATREEPAAPSGRSDQPIAAFGADSPRSAAALYHKIAEAARPATDAPAPAEQLSLRLLHAVADGKRAIQVHLHPAELGSIDVKMQWQGDRMTAQFLVDRPETLQMLQRDLPALERSLSQAGVNVDSGSLHFSLRQQQDQGRSGGGQSFAPARGSAIERIDGRSGDEPLGQIVREGLLSIRV